jgi:predicted transcriptional regulator
MATKSAKKTRDTKSAPKSQVAMTVKLDRETYKRLADFATMGADLLTHQEVMLQAIKEFLNKQKV